jgi:outer membrane protein, multidrug efflux system
MALSLLLMLSAGCKNYKTFTLTNDKTLPGSYTGGNDSLGIAALPVRQLFPDTNLLRLVDTALHHNPDVLMAMQRVEISAANVRYARSFLLPSLEVAGRVGLENYGDYTMNGVGNYDTNLSPNINSRQRIPDPTPDYFIGLRSSWEIDFWGKLKNQKKAAYARFLATRNGYRFVITSITAQIATLYYQLLALDNELDVIEKNIKLQENALDIIQIQKDGARATELAVQQFRAQLQRTRGMQYTVSQQITETENQIKFLTGNFNDNISRDTSIYTLKLPGVLKAGLPSQLLLNRPDIREAELQLSAANADIKAARALFFPSVTLSPYVGFNAFAANLLFDPGSLSYGLLGGITAPIFQRGRLKANYDIQVAQGKQALYAYQKVILGGYLEVMNSMKGIENYNRHYDLKQREVQSLKNAVNVSNDLFLVGRANYLEVITAQRNVLDAELELAATKKNIFINAVNLYRAVGGGWR